MIVLDTNIIAAFMLPIPNQKVIEWLNCQQHQHLYLPSVVIAEVRFGLQRMPSGQRQAAFFKQFSSLLQILFIGRVLGFAQQEAEIYAILRAAREAQGKPMSICDAQIAAIARVHDFAVATRNTKDFEGCGIRLINPFDSLL